MRIKTLIVALLNITSSFAVCSITQNTGLVFNNCSNGSYSGCKTQANISLQCTTSTSLSLALSPGNSNEFNPRKLKDVSTNNTVNYNVFIDAPNTIIWGDGTQNTEMINSSCSGICNFVVYGTVLSNVTAAGNYQDNQTTLTVMY